MCPGPMSGEGRARREERKVPQSRKWGREGGGERHGEDKKIERAQC